MAKLSARGRREIIRVERVRENPEGLPAFEGDSRPTVWARTTYAVMSDGKILVKRQWRVRPNTTWENPNFGTGWTVYATVKAPHEKHRTRWVAVKLAQGFSVVSSDIPVPPPAVKQVAP